MKASRVMKARRNGTCPICHAPTYVGQQITRTPKGWAHTGCQQQREDPWPADADDRIRELRQQNEGTATHTSS